MRTSFFVHRHQAVSNLLPRKGKQKSAALPETERRLETGSERETGIHQ